MRAPCSKERISERDYPMTMSMYKHFLDTVAAAQRVRGCLPVTIGARGGRGSSG